MEFFISIIEMRYLVVLLMLLISSCQKDAMEIVVSLPYSVDTQPAKQKDLTAVVFLDIDCPISQYVIKPMNSIKEKNEANLQLIGILPGEYYSKREKSDFMTRFGVQFELRDDPKLNLVKRLDATITPQCILLDKGGNVIYNGALDNKYEALGRAKPTPSINYLDQAIGQFMIGKEIEFSKTKPIGCLIER